MELNEKCISYLLENALSGINVADATPELETTQPTQPIQPIQPIQPEIPRLWGSRGRSLQFNPFQRTRNVPFSHRRRSIDVFPAIEE